MITSVTRRQSFEALRLNGRRVRCGPVSMVFAPVESQPALAFAIGRRFGTAVERNRARRRLRAAFVQAMARGSLPAGAYQLSGSRRVLEAPFADLVDAIAGCLTRLHGDSAGTRPAPLAKVG